ncbi:MAG: DNA translocase FtsK, partial [Fimbriimonadaceae bacterium]|nr:DNA translocase FtsK [Fimbriimonadaceae bacterium]
MRTTTRPPLSSRKRLEAELSHRATDTLGIAAFAAALIMIVALALGNAGVLGSALGGFFSLLFGRGAWAVPGVLILFGVAFFAGRRSLELSRLTWGALLIFAAVVGAFARDLRGDYFDPEIVSISGGYLGAIIGWALDALLGTAKFVGIGALGMVGIVLCADAPLRAFYESARERAALRKQTRAVPSKASKALKPAKAVIVNPEPERTPTREAEPAKKKFSPKVTETQQSLGTTQQPMPKEGYTLPPLSILAEPKPRPKRTPQEMQQNIETLEGTLEEFRIEANVVEIATGPTITRYEIQLGPGIRVGRITALADNIAMNLAASHVRVEAPIPGKAAIGVEVPNSQPSTVTLRELCDSKEFRDHPSRLCVALGQDVSGVNKYTDLTKMPHLLIGGATNSGKSIGLATIIMSLLMRNTPKDCRMVMIDPKRVELSLFDGIPHLLCPVVKDVKEAPGVLRAVWREMDRRYDQFSEAGVRNIDGWNEKATFAEKLPYIVVIIDELADMMIQAAAEVETSICRLAQLARATGIHLVIATQRPSVDVITGTIKANIASRIAFSVSSGIDSRTILDQVGAERLVGKGDMLFLP